MSASHQMINVSYWRGTAIKSLDRIQTVGRPQRRLNLAQSLLVQQRYGEVIDALDSLLPLMEQRLGRDHRITLLLLSARQQALGSAGRNTDAAEDGERVWRAAAQKDGAPSFAAIAGRADTGISQCRAGRLVAGSANISAALAALGQDAANRGAMKGAVEAALAIV